MKKHHIINRHTLFSILLCLGTISSAPAVASTPLNLSDIPLFLTTTAESNVFFVFDNSRSMDGEAITSNGGDRNRGSTIPYNGSNYSFLFDQYGLYKQDPMTSAWSYATVVNFGNTAAPLAATWGRSSAYNKLYYDPNRIYKPWPVIPNDADTTIQATVPSASATQMTEYPPTAAPINPMDPNGAKVDLTKAWPVPGGPALTGGTPSTPNTYNPMVYYTWTDSTTTGTTGVADPTDTYTKVEISQTGTTQADIDARQNFTNWFVYHRTRLSEAQYAMGKTIVDIGLGTRLRLGYETLDGSGTGQIKMASVTSQVANISDTGYAQRQTMIDSIYKKTATASTPLRAAFQRAGNYFACTGSATSNQNPWSSTTWTSGGTPTDQCALQKTPASDPPAACQQNFVVVVTDGTDNDFNASTPSDSFTAGAGFTDADNDGDTNFDGGGYDTATSTYQAAGPYSSSTTNSMADLAMYYYEQDLDTNIANNVPTMCGVDENAGQHVVTYALSFGADATVTSPTDHPQLHTDPLYCVGTNLGSAQTWDDNFNDSSVTMSVRLQRQINDLKHAAYNGRGKFYSASEPDKLLAGLQNVVSDVASRQGAASSAGFSGTANDSGTLAFISSFYSGSWIGDLTAEQFDSTGTLTKVWSAATKLDAISDTSTGRKIVTYAGGSGEPFTWTGIAGDTDMVNDLKTDTDGTANSAAIAQERLDYIRGVQTCETGATNYKSCSYSSGFRPRISRLGDMVHSSPVYVGASIGSFPDAAPFPTSTSSYSSFQSTISSRTPMVYVGGNDGMLHGFQATYVPGADDGKEVFAFIPSVFSQGAGGSTSKGLHKLTENGGHRAYVDLTPSVADAYTTTPSDATRKWHTVLVGGLRSGGKGVYAIDVTDPKTDMTTEANAASKVMWEFTSADDADLGYTYSEPVIVPLRVSTGSTTSAIQWFAIFGNGYNSTNGNAVLFLLKLSGPTGANGTWQLNTDYYKIDTGVGSTSPTPNGLSSPAVIDNDGDGIYDRVYAGDLQGNMWAFDVSSPTGSPSTDWHSAYTSDGTSTGTPKPLFIASTGQMITTKPLVIRNKASSGGTPPNVLVLFGTGSYMTDTDPTDKTVQSYYSVWDHGTKELTPADLVKKTILTDNTNGARAIDPTSGDPNYLASPPDNGWYMDLTDTGIAKGERVISKSFLVGSNVFFSTLVPQTSACGGGGYNWLMAVNPTTGSSPGIPTFDFNNSGNIDATDIPAIASSNSTQGSGLKLTGSPVMQFSFLADKTPTQPGNPNPCSSGSSISAIGTTTKGDVVTKGLCTGGSSAKAGRYSWRQLDFNN